MFVLFWRRFWFVFGSFRIVSGNFRAISTVFRLLHFFNLRAEHRNKSLCGGFRGAAVPQLKTVLRGTTAVVRNGPGETGASWISNKAKRRRLPEDVLKTIDDDDDSGDNDEEFSQTFCLFRSFENFFRNRSCRYDSIGPKNRWNWSEPLNFPAIWRFLAPIGDFWDTNYLGYKSAPGINPCSPETGKSTNKATREIQRGHF